MAKGIKLDLYRGKVISIEDEDELGKVQIQLLPEMIDILETDCPWFPPFKGNASSNELYMNTPEVGSIIWVLADDRFYDRYYTDFKYNLNGLVDYSKVSTILEAIDDIDTTYKNIQFTLYQDQSLEFHNRSDGSHGFIQNTGSSIIINASGEIVLTGSNISMNGTEDFAVAYTDLASSMSSQDTDTNAELTKISTTLTAMVTAFLALGVTITPYSQEVVTTDISSSKVDTVLLP